MVSRTRKFRGSRTHGRGIKAGRGAGKQGGRGNAGLHKYKFKSMLIYAPDHFGRHGFKRPREIIAQHQSINVGQLDSIAPYLSAAQGLRQDGDTWIANLTVLGIDRLLGGGATVHRWKVYVEHATKHAREKVEVLKEPPAAPAA